MSIAIQSTVPLVTAQSVAAQGFTAQGVAVDVVLQPGTVVNAQVLQLLGNDQVRIAIGGQSLDVASQVPLQAGQTLQLSVSQVANGTINLAVVNPQASASVNQAAAGPAAANATSDAVTLTSALAATSTNAAPQPQLTALQSLAVSVAAQTAATQQASLAPLFANLGVAAASGNLPPLVQQAAALVLGQRTSLDQGLTGSNIQQAFQSSGLFLEASLASGSSGGPDLKAALIVLRQVLTSAIDTITATSNPAAAVPADGTATTATPTTIQATATPATILLEQGADAVLQALPEGSPIQSSIVITGEPDTQTASPSLAPLLASGATSTAQQSDAPEIPQGVLEFSAAASIVASATTPTDAAARSAASSAALNLLQEVIQGSPLASLLTAATASRLGLDGQLLSLLPAVSGARLPNTDQAGVARTNVPPPPTSGALPAAQPVTAASLGLNASAETAIHHLLADTDGAIARQTLLQVASLPDQIDPSTGRIDPTAQRWNFEIPFATPQGTAMAQFQISRDGAGNETETAASRAWRARFTLDVEPSGPVHALVSLQGGKTSIRMWAERPATADQLRAGVSQLSQALSRAELQASDIVIRDGAPSQQVLARAGHFLDRAS